METTIYIYIYMYIHMLNLIVFLQLLFPPALNYLGFRDSGLGSWGNSK